MTTRRGLGKGLGIGYKNLVHKDPYVHGLSAKGVKSIDYTQAVVPSHKAVVPFLYAKSSISREMNTKFTSEQLRVLKNLGFVVQGNMWSLSYNKQPSDIFVLQTQLGITESQARKLAKQYLDTLEKYPSDMGLKYMGYKLDAKSKYHPDTDELYTEGKYIGKVEDSLFNINKEFEVVEKWKLRNKIYYVGRNIEKGESILLNAKGSIPKKSFYQLPSGTQEYLVKEFFKKRFKKSPEDDPDYYWEWRSRILWKKNPLPFMDIKSKEIWENVLSDAGVKKQIQVENPKTGMYETRDLNARGLKVDKRGYSWVMHPDSPADGERYVRTDSEFEVEVLPVGVGVSEVIFQYPSREEGVGTGQYVLTLPNKKVYRYVKQLMDNPERAVNQIESVGGVKTYLDAKGLKKYYKADVEGDISVYAQDSADAFVKAKIYLENKVPKFDVKKYDVELVDSEYDKNYFKYLEKTNKVLHAKSKNLVVGNLVKSVGMMIPYEGKVVGKEGMFALVQQGNLIFRLPMENLQKVTRLSTNVRDKYYKQR